MINYVLLIGALLELTSVDADAYINHALIHAVDVNTGDVHPECAIVQA